MEQSQEKIYLSVGEKYLSVGKKYFSVGTKLFVFGYKKYLSVGAKIFVCGCKNICLWVKNICLRVQKYLSVAAKGENEQTLLSNLLFQSNTLKMKFQKTSYKIYIFNSSKMVAQLGFYFCLDCFILTWIFLVELDSSFFLFSLLGDSTFYEERWCLVRGKTCALSHSLRQIGHWVGRRNIILKNFTFSNYQHKKLASINFIHFSND